MERGFTLAWRRELDSLVWQMPPLYHRIFYYLRQKARWKTECVPTNRGLGMWVSPGMVVTSYDIIARGVAHYERGIERIPSKKTIGSVLRWLEQNGIINVTSNAMGSVIFISNWEKYQNTSGHANRANTRNTSERSSGNHMPEPKGSATPGSIKRPTAKKNKKEDNSNDAEQTYHAQCHHDSDGNKSGVAVGREHPGANTQETRPRVENNKAAEADPYAHLYIGLVSEQS
ncbi:MAG: hypothetical protein HQL05_02845 [Nitrospirae bacterium]|uniref:hypothetical protein n=1 Tax=Candidatus Magnetobacterium casense TaxID=1455061 RepID=UPI00058E3E2D|nr:hypothetical protein [Candidatus Magnetobacterium casensis]MBF0336746.1 hypothetical protein [Nitrospirota bacterium]